MPRRRLTLVGVDLAWSEAGRGRTGLCAVDPEGTVLDSTSVRTTDEIVDWIGDHDGGGLVLGVDAPVTVPNATGPRGCDALVSRAFGAQQAGVYPANRSNPCFASGTRAERIARRLDLDLDPTTVPGNRRVRAAVETYPHAALVALFAFPTSLKYKKKRRRTVETRKPDFRRLLDHLEMLECFDPPVRVTSSPRWAGLRSAVEDARRHCDLGRCEDELDAYVCAYVALHYWTHGDGDRCRVIGDAASGHIVTPVRERHRAVLDGSPGPGAGN